MTDSISSSIGLAPLVLAQMPVANRSEVLIVLLGIAALAVIFNQVAAAWKTLTRGLKESPPPAQTYRALIDCDDRHDSIDQALTAAAGRDEALRLEIKRDIGGVHEKINRAIECIGELRGAVMRKI